MNKKNNWKNKYHYKIKNINSYFPETLDLTLIMCSKKCGMAWLAPAKFEHICHRCRKKMKADYLFRYRLKKKRIFKRKCIYDELPIKQGNQDPKINWIDDITRQEVVDGVVDCLGDVREIGIALAVCTKKCKHTQLVFDGGPQICPICGESMFRLKAKWYVLDE